jgi:hypothetical protein
MIVNTALLMVITLEYLTGVHAKEKKLIERFNLCIFKRKKGLTTIFTNG